MQRPILFGALAILWATASAPAGTIFSDSVFNDADWSSAKILDSTATRDATFQTAPQLAGGNPGAFQRTSLIYNYSGSGNSEGLIVSHLRNGASYNPSTQGAISSIDFAVDSITISQSGGTRPW